MNKHISVLNRLIIVLDDSRNFYIQANRKLISSSIKFLVHQFIQTHALIADDLAELVRSDGLQPTRRGSQLGRLHARYAEWRAISNPEIDMGYLTQIDLWEAHVVRRFRIAAEKAGAVGPELQDCQYDLERMQATAERLMQQMDERSVES